MEDLYNLYLPVAELNISVFILIFLGLFVGILAGMCGIGGSVLLLPVLFSLNIPVSIAIATSLNQVVATSFSTTLVYARKKLVDYHLSVILLFGSFIGIAIGMFFYYWLTVIGQLNLFISIGFLITLTLIGTFSAKEVAILLYYRYRRMVVPNKPIPRFVQNFSLYAIKFPSFKNKISVIFPILLGILNGAMISFMGFGGSLVMAPILLYIFGISPVYVVGTINFQLVFTAVVSYFIHAITFHSYDFVLSVALLIGTAFGAQMGAKIGVKMSQEAFKALLAVTILILSCKIAVGLFARPSTLYEIEIIK